MRVVHVKEVGARKIGMSLDGGNRPLVIGF